MREIKFRAWDDHDKKMWNPDEVVVWNNNFYINPKKKLESKIYGWSHSEKLIMQYTGLKDKNGIEIYFDDALTNGEMTRLVIWREDDSQIQLSVNDDNHDNRIKLTQHLIDEFGLIVCGNIYENPELLEVQNG